MTKRTLTAAAVGALLWSAPGAFALAAGEPPGRVSATLGECHQAPDLASRYATFAAQMTTVPGSAEMSIRLELDERTPGDQSFHPVTGVPGFGVWKNSAPGVDIFGYSQEVSSLSSPASFRVTVGYRWLGPRRRVIKRARRVTPACVTVPSPSGLVVGSLSRAPAALPGP